MNVIERFLREPCPLRLGQRVRMVHEYRSDWPEIVVITGLQWEPCRSQKINVSIMTDDEIEHGYGSTDGWSVDDFVPAEQ